MGMFVANLYVNYTVTEPKTSMLFYTYVSDVSLLPLHMLHVNFAHVPRRSLKPWLSPLSFKSRFSNTPSWSSNTRITWERSEIIIAADKQTPEKRTLYDQYKRQWRKLDLYNLYKDSNYTLVFLTSQTRRSGCTGWSGKSWYSRCPHDPHFTFRTWQTITHTHSEISVDINIKCWVSLTRS